MKFSSVVSYWKPDIMSKMYFSGTAENFPQNIFPEKLHHYSEVFVVMIAWCWDE